MNIKAFLALLLVFCVLLPALAQTKPAPAPQNPQPAPPQTPSDDKDDIVKITTNLVQVDAVVTKDGKPITDLTANDFEIYEDGKRQTITSFAYISNVPGSTSRPVVRDKSSPVVPYGPVKPNETRRTMAFVVDDLGLSAESMGQVRKQLRKFIAEDLQPNDLVAIIRTGGEMGALQQFTNDKRILMRAAERLRWNICSRVGVHVFEPAGRFNDGVHPCGWGSYYSTLKSVRFIVDAMGYLPGRKSLVLMSDSMPRESQDEFLTEQGVLKDAGIVKQTDDILPGTDTTNYLGALQKIAEKAVRSSVVIYSVDTQGLQYTGPTAADTVSAADPRGAFNLMNTRSNLLFARREGGDLIARQTGGFQVRNSNGYGLERIAEDQSGYYLLGYRPTDETFNRHFHHIKAKVKRSGMSLRTRFGFFGVTEEDAARAKRPSTQDLTNLALASPFTAQDIELDMTSFFADDKSVGTIVRSFVYIDATNLTFSPLNGRQQASIELHGVVFGDNGRIVEQLKRGATLSLSESDYRQALANGMGLSFDMPVRRPGAYQVRLVVRDRVSSKIGSAGQFVSVPDLKNKKLAVSGIVLGIPNADHSITNAGGRRFQQNDNLYFAYNVYNAANETGKLRNLVMNTRIFRDDKVVYSGPEVPISAANQTDLSRLFVNSVLKLGPDLEPGNYYLEVVVTEKDTKEKAEPVIQWIDFQIEKGEK
jgi:VWFA-related protein